MADKNNSTCSICGKSYHKCLSCRDSVKLQPYKMHCCSADCYKVFQLVRGYNVGVYNKDEFKSKLENIDLGDLENYKEHIKVLIKDTLKNNEIVEALKAESTEDENAFVKRTIATRKRNYKVNNETEEVE